MLKSLLYKKLKAEQTISCKLLRNFSHFELWEGIVKNPIFRVKMTIM